MKSVLISIQPKWVEKIANGQKTIEVRKTRPKIDTPFKCYIYATKPKECFFVGKTLSYGTEVVAEFICDRITEWHYLPDYDYEEYGDKIYYINSADGHATCLTYDEIENYGKGKTLYGWHISNLKIYDKPKELSEIKSVEKLYRVRKNTIGLKGGKTLTRPPQSWCYVEELTK